AVHAVDAENSDPPLLDVGAEGADHTLTFHLPLVASARREGENGRAVIAVNGDAHVPIETVRVPTLMVTMHAVRGYWVDGWAEARRAENGLLRSDRSAVHSKHIFLNFAG